MLERVWRKGNPLTLLVGMQTSTATLEKVNSLEIFKKFYELEDAEKREPSYTVGRNAN